jgi:flagellar hook protein FlgE
MSLSEALYSGVTGLQVHQTALDVIGNNIANVDTVGFKASSVSFQDQLSQTLSSGQGSTGAIGGENPSQVGLGVSVGSIAKDQTQGTLEATGNTANMAIQGNGFFLVGNGSSTYYTRDGSFNLDNDGYLVNDSGMSLLGYTANASGQIDTSQPITSSSTLNVPVGTLTSLKQTTTATLGGNLDASSAVQTTQLNLAGEVDYGSSPGTITNTVYDSSGNAHTIGVEFGTEVQYGGSVPAGAPAGAIGQISVTLNVDSNLQSPQTLYIVQSGNPATNSFVFAGAAGNITGSNLTATVPGSNGASNFAVQLNFSGLTAANSVTASVDGQTSPTPEASTQLDLAGNLNLNGTFPVTLTKNVVQLVNGSPKSYTVTTTISSPTVATTGGATPTGARDQYNVKISYDTVPPTGATTLYDSSAGDGSPLYYVPGSGFVTADASGNVLGSNIELTGGSVPTTSTNSGMQIAANFPIEVGLSNLTATSVQGTANGQAGPVPTATAALDVYDGLGVQHDLEVTFQRQLVGPGAPAGSTAAWSWSATENGNVVATSSSTGNALLYFNSSGSLINSTNQTVTVTPAGGATPFKVALNLDALTQNSATDSVSAQSQDGFPVGTLQSFTVSDSGLITGVFSNGQTSTLGQVAMASFSNPNGLESVGQNLYAAADNAGQPEVGVPNLSGRGQITTGYVEQSNVDLSTEFTNLIVFQRGFEANTRIVSVVDQLLQDVLNMKQA